MAFLRHFLILLLVTITLQYCSGRNFERSRTKRETYDDLNEFQNDNEQVDNEQNDDVLDQDEDGEDADEDKSTGPPPQMLSTPQNFIVKIGDTVTLPCKAANADNGVKMWQKNEQLLFQDNFQISAKTNIARQSDNSLVIKGVTQDDLGTYLCTIVTSGTITVTHELKTPPTITEILPQGDNQRVLEDQVLELTCKATGYPVPRITWYKIVDNSSVRVVPSERLELSEGTVHINKVHRNDAGRYICSADNGPPATPYMKDLQIMVLGKPHAHVPRAKINGEIGEKAHFECVAHVEPAPEILWEKDGKELGLMDSPHITINYEDNNQITTLDIPKIAAEDFGVYQCKASNQYGRHSKSVVLTRLPVIEDLRVDDSGNVTWTIHSHQPLKAILLELGVGDEVISKLPLKPSEPVEGHYVMSYKLTDLTANVSYTVKLTAENSFGNDTLGAEFLSSYEALQPQTLTVNPNSATRGVLSSAILTIVCLTYILM